MKSLSAIHQKESGPILLHCVFSALILNVLVEKVYSLNPKSIQLSRLHRWSKYKVSVIYRIMLQHTYTFFLIGETIPFVRNVFTLRDCAPIVGTDVRSFHTEVDLLQGWRDFVQEVNIPSIASL